ncbi:MAG TPA: ATP-binding cassette domain-containing protein, partial [Planctomycetaceae bacterium]|nr:ATP-binding cassette domain-containing protein [Planctomycetaceae bacterium]
PAGERWALVGPTGSGKTTIVALLLRFYDPTRGRILIDGVDLREMRQADLRARSGFVMQEIHLFAGDLQENLLLGGGDPSRLESAAQATFASRVIERLPGGFHAKVAERGANLSVGERQLLSFTRALVRDPELLVLDEATSAVDPATEAILATATHRMLDGRTALVVAHRLSTIRDCHRILVLQQGELVEQGTHVELTDRRGVYHSLHALQSREAVCER